MKLERIRDLKAPQGHAIPAFLLTPGQPAAGVLAIPPYGGSKEHMLGIAEAIAEQGLATLCLDNCGHGENLAPIGVSMLDEVNVGIEYLRRFGRVAASGISLGGRLALMSAADCMVAISPAVVQEMSPQGKWMFENFPSPAVREPYSGYVIELLDQLGPVQSHDKPCLLLYAERDIPAILQGAESLHKLLPGSEVRYITKELRPDVQHENGLIRYLPRWFNHGELKFNFETMRTTAEWIGGQLASPAAARQRA